MSHCQGVEHSIPSNTVSLSFFHLLGTPSADSRATICLDRFLPPIFLPPKRVINIFYPVLLFQLDSRCKNWIPYRKKYGNIGQCSVLGGYYAERLSDIITQGQGQLSDHSQTFDLDLEKQALTGSGTGSRGEVTCYITYPYSVRGWQRQTLRT